MWDALARVDRRNRPGKSPHISADWPHSWRTIQAAFSGVDPAERRAILAGNAMRLYGFGDD